MPRESLDLGGTWEFWCARDDAKAPPADAAWGEMAVPSNWHLAGLPNYAGTVFFRRRFPHPQPLTPSPQPPRALLRFHGVDYFARVWLNGRELGSHEGYFGPFEFEVTGLLAAENDLLVRVSAPREAPGAWPNQKRLIKGIFQHHDCRPGSIDPERGQDEGTGGIWNRVELEIVPSTYLAELRVSARPPRNVGGPARVMAALEIDAGSRSAARLRLTARRSPRPFGKLRAGSSSAHARGGSASTLLLDTAIQVVPGRDWRPFELELPEPRLWWCWDQGDPDLYELDAELSLPEGSKDEKSVRFGVRELRIEKDTTWWLNGRRIFPRGTNIIPTQWLSTYDHAMIDRDVALLKEANVNAIRVHAHVNRRELYQACDEVGILVWQDFALQWSYEESEEFRLEATRQIADMGTYLYNHPSIVVWCCHNEPSFNRDTLDPLLATALRSVDQSRHIEAASDFLTHPYPGWYWSGVDEFRAVPAGPFVSEFGAQALPGRAALEAMFAPEDLWPPSWRAWAYRDFQYDQTVNVAGVAPGESLEEWIERSQRYQARLLQVAIESYRRARFQPISGLFQFMFVECWDAISWAVLDYQRRPKAGFNALRRAYQPLLPSIDLRREHCLPGGQIQAGFWLVNDLPRAFHHLLLRFGLRDLSGRVWWSDQRSIERLDADSALAVHSIQASGFSPWSAPEDAPPGLYQIFSELLQKNGELLAANEAAFEIRPAPGGL